MEKVIVSKNSSEKEGVEKRKDLKMKDKVIKMFNVSLRGKKKAQNETLTYGICQFLWCWPVEN